MAYGAVIFDLDGTLLDTLDGPRPSVLRAGHHTLDLAERVQVMGILNVTPDSFSDGGQCPTPEVALARAEAMGLFVVADDGEVSLAEALLREQPEPDEAEASNPRPKKDRKPKATSVLTAKTGSAGRRTR